MLLKGLPISCEIWYSLFILQRVVIHLLFFLMLIDSEADKSKFEIIYTEYRALMFWVADRVLDDTRDAEDVVQQSFIKLIGILDKITEPKCPQTRALVVTITERTAIDLRRAKRRHGVVSLDDETVLVPARSALDSLPERSAVAEAIALLPTRSRELLLLKYDGGWSNREIAEMLNMSEENVKKSLQRAKAKLAEALEKTGALK